MVDLTWRNPQLLKAEHRHNEELRQSQGVFVEVVRSVQSACPHIYVAEAVDDDGVRTIRRVCAQCGYEDVSPTFRTLGDKTGRLVFRVSAVYDYKPKPRPGDK